MSLLRTPCCLQVTHSASTHVFSLSEFEPPFPSSRERHAKPGAMDPFTEVRELAGAAGHVSSRPPPSFPTFCQPPGTPGGERVRARAQSVRAGGRPRTLGAGRRRWERVADAASPAARPGVSRPELWEESFESVLKGGSENLSAPVIVVPRWDGALSP